MATSLNVDLSDYLIGPFDNSTDFKRDQTLISDGWQIVGMFVEEDVTQLL